MHVDAAYYISRVLIPPLERIFNLVGANVRAWYDEMPKTIKADRIDPITFSPRKTKKDDGANRFKIDEHFQSSQCLVCGDVTPAGRNIDSFKGSISLLLVQVSVILVV
jgi:DNA polymerase zeta